MGMQTTLVSTAEVMNKQIVASNSTTTTTTAGGAGAAHGRVGPGGDSPGMSYFFDLLSVIPYFPYPTDC